MPKQYRDADEEVPDGLLLAPFLVLFAALLFARGRRRRNVRTYPRAAA